MWSVVKRLSLGLALIVLTSAILIGLNFYDVGRDTSKLVQVLDGTPIARIPSAIITTRFLLLNTRALENLRDPWRAPPELLARARVIIDEHGRREQGAVASAAGEKR